MSTERITAADVRRQQAEGRLLVIRNALEVADQELAQVLEARDWEVFGLSSFRAYCDEKLPGLEFISLRKPQREARIEALLAVKPDLTIPELVAATGSSLGTVHRYLQQRDGGRTRQPAFQMETAPSPVAEPTHVLVARAIAACGPAGGTTIEVMKRLKWRQGPASVALSRAVKKRLVTATGERRHAEGASPGFAVYVVAEGV